MEEDFEPEFEDFDDLIDSDEPDPDLKVFSPFESGSILYYPELVSDEFKISASSSSLTDQCCTVVARQFKFFKDESVRIPIDLFPKLLMEAISNDFRDSAEILISKWPLKIISMLEVVPSVQAHLVQRATHAYSLEEASKGLLTLFRVCLNVLNKGVTTYWNVLDLRGSVLSNDMLRNLIDEIVSLSNNKLLSDNYHIIIDCTIDYTDKLMAFLEMTRKSQKKKINLHFNKLSLDCLSNKQAWKLLKLINPTELTGLFLHVTSHRLFRKIFKKFNSLTALGLYAEGKQMIPFDLLPRLHRLYLTAESGGFFSCVPKSCLPGLEYLRIDDCDVENDLKYLISTSLNLRELEVQNCEVRASEIHLWRKLFRSLAPTLMMLNIRRCVENENVFPSLVNCILPLINLTSLFMPYTDLSSRMMFEQLPILGTMPNLKRIVLSPVCEDICDSLDDIEAFQNYWLEAIEREMAAAKLHPAELNWC